MQPTVGIALPVSYINENIAHHFYESNTYGGGAIGLFSNCASQIITSQ
ncbi:hypothetical protein [Nostoc sp.]